MRVFIDKLGGVRSNVLIGIFLLLLIGALALYFGFRETGTDGAETDVFQETQSTFQSQRSLFSFLPGEVKLSNEDDVDAKNLIFADAHVEGRIVSEPVVNGDFYEFAVSFPKSDGESIETTVTLPAGEDKTIGIVVANDGIIGSGEPSIITHSSILVSEAASLIKKGDPIQLLFYLHEVSDELRGQVVSNSFCQESSRNRDLCRDFLDKLERWYAGNLQLVEAVESGGELPENHRVGAVLELIVFDEE